MRSVVLRYDDLPRLLLALESAKGQVLPLPAGVIVRDGEWVLALFELDATSRATAAAGKGIVGDDGMALVFERRDWERLHQFASARSEPPEQPKTPSLRATHAGLAEPERLSKPTSSLRQTQSWESIPMPAEERITDAGPPPEDSPSWPSREEESPMTVRQPLRLRGEGSRVLLVDDDSDLREVVAALLEAVGLEVVPAASAEEALELARGDAPDLVVLDWNLPKMSGLDMLKQVRADSLLSAMPILFLTANAATQNMVEAFAAGADDYVIKPFRAAELGARIFGLLRRTRGVAQRP